MPSAYKSQALDCVDVSRRAPLSSQKLARGGHVSQYRINEQHWILKRNHPGGGFPYKIQHYGHLEPLPGKDGESEEPEWSPCVNLDAEDPKHAVRNAQRLFAEAYRSCRALDHSEPPEIGQAQLE